MGPRPHELHPEMPTGSTVLLTGSCRMFLGGGPKTEEGLSAGYLWKGIQTQNRFFLRLSFVESPTCHLESLQVISSFGSLSRCRRVLIKPTATTSIPTGASDLRQVIFDLHSFPGGSQECSTVRSKMHNNVWFCATNLFCA